VEIYDEKYGADVKINLSSGNEAKDIVPLLFFIFSVLSG
jgi:hypothetical protein